MRTPMRAALAVTAALAAVLAAIGATSPAQPAHAAAVRPAHAAAAASAPFYNCYPNVAADSGGTNPECHLGPFIVQQPRSVPGQPVVYNDFVVTDPNDAAQLWQGINALYEGTAPFCSTDKTLVRMVMCAGGEIRGTQEGIGNPVINLWETSRTTEQPYIAMHLLSGQTLTLGISQLQLLDSMTAAGLTPASVTSLLRMLAIARARGWHV